MTCPNHPDREPKAFCQNCGKPLCAECARIVGQAVFCEPCLEMRLAAAAAAQPPFGAAASGQPSAGYQSAGYQGSGYQSVPPSSSSSPWTSADGAPTGGAAAPLSGYPNPGIALVLGFLPGVGAMYNGQYAKGVVHLIVFAVLVSLTDQNGLFGLFIAIWLFYQAFEAYHTARARRDGTPLPNPFGLNDIGERFGFGRSWPSSTSPAGTSAVPPPVSAYAGPFSNPGSVPPPPAAGWGSPVETFVPVTPIPPAAPSRFPVGALVLIGFGVLFLLGNTHMFVGLPIHYLLPFLLIGVGVYIFVRRMTSTGVGLSDDGTPAYRLRLVSALRNSVWIILVGVLFLLDTLNILSWGRSWPLFIIVGGIMAFVQRGAYSNAAAAAVYPGYGPGYAPAPSPQTPPSASPEPASPGTALIPRDREGA